MQSFYCSSGIPNNFLVVTTFCHMQTECRGAHQNNINTRTTQRAQTSADPEDLDFDFGLPDPKRDPDHHQNCITWSLSHALPLQKISSKSVHKFASNPTDRQTNRQTNRLHQKHNLLLRRR